MAIRYAGYLTLPGLICVLGLVAGCSNAQAKELGMGSDRGTSSDDALELWYTQPAKEWVEALPVGNGRLGAMVFGAPDKERLQFNEDTLWTGRPCDYLNPGAAECLPKVRKLLFEGKQKEAEKVAMGLMSKPIRQMAYQPFGDLRLHFPGHEQVGDYRRSLDIDAAIARVSYRVGDTTFRREVFSSAPDQVIVVRITADKPGAVAFTATMDSPHTEARTRAVGKDQLALTGKVKGHVLKFEARLRVGTDGGEAIVTDDGVTVKNADAATLTLAAATSYVNFQDVSGNPAARCDKTLAAIAGKDYAALRQAHVADHRGLFRRVAIDLGKTEAAEDPTDVRIKRFAERDDPALAALYFQYGRYLLIAASRPGCQPANLQGIWNDKLSPPWDSKWTTNINTEMNYWPAEMCNLSECHEPLFDMIDDLVVSGRKTAKVHYNCRGWVFHHNTDLWRGTAPINATNHGIWVTGGAWLCQHLWWRYAFTGDKDFLAKRAYPVMKEAALFFVDFLIEDPKTGRLISTPSNSPENGGLVAGPTMDHQIIRNLLGHCIEAGTVLGVDDDLRQKLTDIRARIAPNQIGRYGQLQEWLEDKDDPKSTHRHVSHLWALHPGCEITPRGTPKLAEACKVTLRHRGDGGTGWSMAWKVNFWTRLHDGQHAYKMLTNLISRSTLPNMFDTHPPFQIDGNFGGTSGITEMLLQSHTGRLDLLPALPKDWPTGSVKGLCARGGFEVGIEWKDGKLVAVTLLAKCGGTCKLRYGEKVVEFEAEPGKRYRLNGSLERT
ncbi:MAG: glycoside hydrolase family 95 protein [Phycisphaerae bacterium]|nr:glycoside hydrolase family 95 protein [Phycisphaerae bacterium]